MSTLVLTLDDSLAARLAIIAERSHKPLPEWATEQLTQLVSKEGARTQNSAYSEEWRASFGSISDPDFESPARLHSRAVDSLDAN